MKVDDRDYIQLRCPHDVKLKAKIRLLKRGKTMQEHLYPYLEALAAAEEEEEEKLRLGTTTRG